MRVALDGRFEDPPPTHGGLRFFDGGTTAVLETTDDHTLVLTSKRTGNTSLEQMYSVGVRPERFKVVVAKGVVSPRPAYAPIAAGDRAGQHARRDHVGPVVLHLPPPPAAALPVRARRHLLTGPCSRRRAADVRPDRTHCDSLQRNRIRQPDTPTWHPQLATDGSAPTARHTSSPRASASRTPVPSREREGGRRRSGSLTLAVRNGDLGSEHSGP